MKPQKMDKENFDNQWSNIHLKIFWKTNKAQKTFAKLLKYISWDDARCEIRFEERIWLVKK